MQIDDPSRSARSRTLNKVENQSRQRFWSLPIFHSATKDYEVSMNFRKRIAAISASVLVLGSLAAVGTVAAVATATQAQAAGTISVTCLDWYDSNKKKWHVEAHVKDANGNGVVGAKVFFENSVDPAGTAGPYVYQVSTSSTSLYGGVGQGSTCGTRKSTTVTSDQCAPANSPKGVYTARITNVIAPAGSGLVWDGITPANSYVRTTP